MAQNLELELQRIGLNEREAKVYLAALELGPSPVQKIAQRADIPRATVYLILDDLRNKGFVTTYDEGKKTFFVAESPERLSGLLDEKEAQLQVQKEAIKKLVPELMSRGQFEKTDRPLVKYYEGAQAINALVRDFMTGRGGELLNIYHLDKAIHTLDQVKFPIKKVRERREKNKIKSRVIYTTNSNKPIEGYSRKERKAKFVPVDLYSFDADIVIRDDNVFFVPYGVPLRGVGIQDKAIADSMRMIFELLWQNLA